MGACASKFKDFKDDVPPPAEKEEAAAVDKDEVKLVEETVSKDEVVPAAEDGDAKPRSLGHLLKEIEGGKQEEATPQENENATSPEPEPVADDAEAKGETEKAPPATDDLESNNPEENKAEADENVGVEASEEKAVAETFSDEEKKKTEEEPAPESKNADEAEKEKEENKLAEDTKMETPTKVEEEDDKQVVEPTKTESAVENKAAAEVITTDEKKPVSDPKDGEDKTNN